MLGIVRIARGCGIEAATILEHAVDCDTGEIDWEAPWNRNKVPELHRVDVTAHAVTVALLNEDYQMTDLRRDLKDLKAIMKLRWHQLDPIRSAVSLKEDR